MSPRLRSGIGILSRKASLVAAGVPLMQLGFVSAIFGDRTLEEVLSFASGEGFACVELMCWPPGKADRRYAGVTHLDVTRMGDEEVGRVHGLLKKTGVSISGLG